MRWWFQRSRLPPLSTLGPGDHIEIFICYMMHESAASSRTTSSDLWTHLRRCNMTRLPPSILAPWRRFNEFLSCDTHTVCVTGFGCFLILVTSSSSSQSWKAHLGTWRRTCAAILFFFISSIYLFIYLFPFLFFGPQNWKESARQIAHIEFVCLFFPCPFSLNDNSNWIVTGRFPNSSRWQTTMQTDIWIRVFDKFGPYEAFWHGCMWGGGKKNPGLHVFTRVLSNKSSLLCCYFEDTPEERKMLSNIKFYRIFSHILQ